MRSLHASVQVEISKPHIASVYAICGCTAAARMHVVRNSRHMQGGRINGGNKALYSPQLALPRRGADMRQPCAGGGEAGQFLLRTFRYDPLARCARSCSTLLEHVKPPTTSTASRWRLLKRIYTYIKTAKYLRRLCLVDVLIGRKLNLLLFLGLAKHSV